VLFEAGPGYVGHPGMVPNVGDYHTLAWEDHARVLVRNDTGVALLANICRHRQAIILEGRGNTRHIVCPVHRWAYDLAGHQIAAPRFAANPCLDLERLPLHAWRGLLFSGPREPAADLADVGHEAELDCAHWRLGRVVLDEYPINWKTFVETYLEDYHVPAFHPGLSHFVDLDALAWEFGTRWSVQTVGIRRGLARPGSPAYGRWHEAVLRRFQSRLPRHGAIWFMYYPNVMVERYPDTLVVSIAIPRAPDHTTNLIEFYYPEDVLREDPSYAEAEQAAYLETAREDEEICRRIERGRRALHRAGKTAAGPYQSPMEDGMGHFHAFLRRELEPRLA
jgi:phenylpropionate dioxygenase-like ring-hydroxylating dioxygenase large terminal subunit